MQRRLPGPPSARNESYWHPERDRSKTPPPRWVPCDDTGKPLAPPLRTRKVAELWPDVSLVLDRRSGHFFHPTTRERKHHP